MAIVWDNIVVATVFTVLAAVLGFIFMIIGVFMIRKILNALTPAIDEEREILRGNLAVAKYFGGMIQAMIIGMSLIIAAAIIAGISG